MARVNKGGTSKIYKEILGAILYKLIGGVVIKWYSYVFIFPVECLFNWQYSKGIGHFELNYGENVLVTPDFL